MNKPLQHGQLRLTCKRTRALARVFAFVSAILFQAQPVIAADAVTQSPAEQLAVLKTAIEHGLNPSDYETPALESLVEAGEDALQYQSRLGAALARLTSHLAQGRVQPSQADPQWHIPVNASIPGQDDLLPDEALPENKSAGRTSLGSVPIFDADEAMPPHSEYRALLSAMRRYLEIERAGGWNSVGEGADLKLGVRHEDVPSVRNRLRATGDYAGFPEADTLLFETNLAKAVREFQYRHGLYASGKVNARTRAAMNVEVATRIEQIAVAMERWRWLPDDFGDQYIWVNAADATLKVVRDGADVLSMRAIVGHSTRPTPSLVSNLQRMVFNPTWTVPVSIAGEDVLPKVRRDPGFLERNGFRVYRWSDRQQAIDSSQVDWMAIDPARMPYVFVQQPGLTNSLGRVKFALDNPYDIYIHDSPARGLFGLRVRTFSSGCVRLERAIEFADYLLRADGQEEAATSYLDSSSPSPRVINLKNPLPVYIVYITTWADESGRAFFRRDLYDRDRGVSAALAAPLTRSAEAAKAQVGGQ